MRNKADGLYIMLISVHGLIRGHELELGRDADTGGQTKYVAELARYLGEHVNVSRVDLLTRQVIDNKIDADYAQPVEKLAKNVSIIRLPCGPKRYLRKEVLWPYLDSFVDNILQHLRSIKKIPDVVHAHYADAGYVGTRMVQLLGVPLIFTGHSLGRVKKQRLLEKGSKPTVVESQYNISQRIEAEEITLGNANLVITSTSQEVHDQYSLYDNYQPRRMMVIPPGLNLNHYCITGKKIPKSNPINSEIRKFLHHPDKPIILSLSRADERKNIAGLLRAYGEHPQLREIANLVIVAGNRDDISKMDKGQKQVLSSLLLLIDKYDLYGHVAYPKHHNADDVPNIFSIAAQSQGVFVNPALTEPFGLTLIEAAASGLPLVATQDGGPRDIIGTCKNGLLVNPLDSDAIANALTEVLTDKISWKKWAENGIKCAHKHYSWNSHIDKYVDTIGKVVKNSRRSTDANLAKRNKLPTVDRIIVCDIDNTLIGDDNGLYQLLEVIEQSEGKVGFAVATGRHIDSTLELIEEYRIPMPDLLITSVGSEIHYGHKLVQDIHWTQHINYRWKPDALHNVLSTLKGIKLQISDSQRKHKISYLLDPSQAPTVRDISSQLRKRDLHAKVIYSHQTYLDLLPVRASKGLAVRYIAMKWGIPTEKILVAGDSGNDEEMLRGNTLGIVVGNYSEELRRLKNKHNVYFANAHYAKGVLEGMQYYGYLDDLEAVIQDDKDKKKCLINLEKNYI